MSLSVAVILYTVRDEAAADLPGTLRQIKALGYDGVELCGFYGHTATEVKAMLDEVGLQAPSAHVNIMEMLADPDKTFADYALVGCKYVAVPHVLEDRRVGGALFEQNIKDIAFLAQKAKEHGIQLLYHNHDFEFEKVGDEFYIDYLYRTVGPDLLHCEFDTCWVKVAGQDPAAYLRKYAGRCPVVHLKDFVGQKNDAMYELIGTSVKADASKPFEFRPVGSGLNDFPSILKAAEEIGSEWVSVEQDRPSMGLTPMECVAKSREYLKSIGY